MRNLLILASNSEQAAKFAAAKKLHIADYRFASSATALRGLRPEGIIELPCFQERMDRFAILSEVQKMKWMNPELKHVVIGENGKPVPEAKTKEAGK